MNINKKVKTLLASFLLVGNLLYPSLALADTNVVAPTAPTAPVAPTVSVTGPTAPTAPNLSTTPAQTTDPVVDVTSAPAPTNTSSNNDGPHHHRQTSTVNSGNGADSTNNSSTNATDTTNVNQNNNADVTNAVNVTGDSGNNAADKNMGAGTVTTGDTSVGASIVNDINNNHVTIGDLCGLGCSDGFVDANLANGSGTINNADGSLTRAVVMNNANNLSLQNLANINSNTGNNNANKNMGDGTIVSGDADVVFNTVNLGNNNFINPDVVTFNVLDDRSDDLTINFPAGAFLQGSGSGSANSGNGAGSLNDANTTSNTTNIINSSNDLNLDNNITLSADTGHNTADKNMGSGNIQTGNANIVSNIVNFLNNTIVAGAQFLIGTVNIYGDMSGNIILPREADLASCGCAADLTTINSGNGADSTNNASNYSTNTTGINQANNATINTNLNLDANTGGNDTSKNMGDASVTTGNTNVNSQVATVANTNTVGNGDMWWLVIVNNQGNYEGHIVGAADGATIDGSGLDFGVNPDGSVYALNTGNGADSTNNASTSTNNTTEMNQTNNATINNNININANTGDNKANENMQGANIKTGDVNVASNIVNFVNNNFIGKKFMVLFVNVFGKFTGSIVPPDQDIPGKGSVTNQDGVSTQVNLPKTTTLKSTKKTTATVLGGGSVAGVNTSLGQALVQGGKLLDQAASTTNTSVNKVVNSTSAQKGAFSVNFVLLGIALLLIAAYAFVSRRRNA